MEEQEILHSPPVGHVQRPKGILKNRSSSNTNAHEPTPQATPEQEPNQDEREIVLQNTLHNAGPRRSSSHPSQTSGSRRQSGFNTENADASPRLKWDEANLYLAEQEREAAGTRMKIDEPKTPFATRYDPMNDDMADAGLDPGALMVDEVDRKLLMSKERDIPDLDIGEAAETDIGQTSSDERRVMVDEAMADADQETNGVHHGEGGEFASEEEKEKHRHFEELRKKHYEMKNIKDLLGHPESLDEIDDDK